MIESGYMLVAAIRLTTVKSGHLCRFRYAFACYRLSLLFVQVNYKALQKVLCIRVASFQVNKRVTPCPNEDFSNDRSQNGGDTAEKKREHEDISLAKSLMAKAPPPKRRKRKSKYRDNVGDIHQNLSSLTCSPSRRPL